MILALEAGPSFKKVMDLGVCRPSLFLSLKERSKAKPFSVGKLKKVDLKFSK